MVGIILVAFIEFSVILWFYGVDQIEVLFVKNQVVDEIHLWLKLTWKYVCPGLILVIMVLTFSNLTVVKYKDKDYPLIAHVFGGFISLLSVFCIPAGLILMKSRTNESFMRRSRGKRSNTSQYMTPNSKDKNKRAPRAPSKH